MAEFTIGETKVGTNSPCYIIAEAGVNHNGSLDTAKELIDAAVKSGANAVKFQVLTADGLYVRNAGTFTTEWGEEHDIYSVWKKTEVPQHWIPELARYSKERGITFFSSVFDEETVDLLDPYVDVYKIASSETTHIPLLQKVAKTGKPIIFSIGGADIKEVREAFHAVKEAGNSQIGILYCVPKYPTPLKDANVRAVETLLAEFPDVVVGYSDHSMNPGKIPAAAVTYGVKIIEKHFTLSRNMSGIDHKMSLEPGELSMMVSSIRQTEDALREGRHVPIDSMLVGTGHIVTGDPEIMRFIRRTIFATQPIARGEVLCSHNIRVLRPGNRSDPGALHPREYSQILGTRAVSDIPLNAFITQDHTS